MNATGGLHGNMFNNYRDLADRDQKKADHLVAFELYRARRGEWCNPAIKSRYVFCAIALRKYLDPGWLKKLPGIEDRSVKGRFDLRYNNILGMLATSMKAGKGLHGGTPALIQGLNRGSCTPG